MPDNMQSSRQESLAKLSLRNLSLVGARDPLPRQSGMQEGNGSSRLFLMSSAANSESIHVVSQLVGAEAVRRHVGRMAELFQRSSDR